MKNKLNSAWYICKALAAVIATVVFVVVTGTTFCEKCMNALNI